jgi:hypothetical protein
MKQKAKKPIKILKMEFEIGDLIKVTFINENNMFDMVKISNELFNDLFDLKRFLLMLSER